MKTAHSDPIPNDLLIDIFSRLPAKFIARCHCLSRLWSSILRRQYFTELFLTRSTARPLHLFMFVKDREMFFFSSPQPQNLDETMSLVANFHMKFSFDNLYYSHCGGLVCLIDNGISKGTNEILPVICNPSTGQSLTLPKGDTRRGDVSCYLGYDPIGKQYKVLSISWRSKGEVNGVLEEHQILTVRTENPLWRRIEGSVHHYCPYFSDEKGVCINGVLYYVAMDYHSLVNDLVVCFDVRSEKFSFVKVTRREHFGTLVNYNGKLGLFDSKSLRRQRKSFELWVLEDAENQKWSKYEFVLPDIWNNVVGEYSLLRFVGVTRTNEIVLSSYSVPFYIVYYNTERNTVRKIEIKGMEALWGYREVYIFPDHVENVKLLEDL